MRRGGHASRRLLQGGTESLPSPRCKAPVRIEGDNRTRKGRLTGERGGDGLSGAVPLELQRELRGGGARLALRVLRAHAAHPGDPLPPRRAHQAAVGGGGVPVGALPAWPRVLHALPAARGRFRPRHHLRPRPHLEPAALRGRHRRRRAAGRGAAGRQRRAVRPVRLHRGPRPEGRRARIGRPGLPGVARHRARPAHRPVRRLPVRVPHLRDDRPCHEHARRALRMAAGSGVAARPARPGKARACRRHVEPRHREAGGGLLHRHGARRDGVRHRGIRAAARVLCPGRGSRLRGRASGAGAFGNRGGARGRGRRPLAARRADPGRGVRAHDVRDARAPGRAPGRVLRRADARHPVRGGPAGHRAPPDPGPARVPCVLPTT